MAPAGASTEAQEGMEPHPGAGMGGGDQGQKGSV